MTLCDVTDVNWTASHLDVGDSDSLDVCLVDKKKVELQILNICVVSDAVFLQMYAGFYQRIWLDGYCDKRYVVNGWLNCGEGENNRNCNIYLFYYYSKWTFTNWNKNHPYGRNLVLLKSKVTFLHTSI